MAVLVATAMDADNNVIDLTLDDASESERSASSVPSTPPSEVRVPVRRKRSRERSSSTQPSGEDGEYEDIIIIDDDDDDEDEDQYSDGASTVPSSDESADGSDSSFARKAPKKKAKPAPKPPAPVSERPWLPASILKHLFGRVSPDAYRADKLFDEAAVQEQRRLSDERTEADERRIGRARKRADFGVRMFGPLEHKKRRLVADYPRQLPRRLARDESHSVPVTVAYEAKLRHPTENKVLHLKRGDCVAVLGGRDGDGKEQIWIGRVLYHFKVSIPTDDDMHGAFDGEHIRTHLFWFETSSSVSFGAFLPAHFLLLNDGCNDVSLGEVFVRSVNVRKLERGEALPPIEKDKHADYFYWAHWDSNNTRLVEASKIEDLSELPKGALDLVDAQDEPICCPSCARDVHRAWGETPHLLPIKDGQDGFSFEGVEYHLGDCVLITPAPQAYAKSDNTRAPFIVGKIQGWDLSQEGEEEVKVEYFVLADDILPKAGRISAERELIQIPPAPDSTASIKIKFLCGKVHVEHWENVMATYGKGLKSLSREDRKLVALARLEDDECESYFVRWRLAQGPLTPHVRAQLLRNPRELDSSAGLKLEAVPASELGFCHSCTDGNSHERAKRQRGRDLAAGANSPYVAPALACYAGAGFLDAGLKRGNSFEETSFLCEMDPIPAAAAKVNHPGSRVFVSKVSELLHDSHQNRSGLPRPGSIFSATGGPPCQSFSRSNVNHGKAWADGRSLECFVYLATILRFQIGFGLQENVRQIADATLSEFGKKGELFHLFLSILALEGYAINLSVLNAVQHGAAQVRRRLFVLFAKRGIPLPELPQPSHSFVDGFHLTSIDVSSSDDAKTIRGGSSLRLHGHSLYRPVQFGDAISDLRPFELRYPSPKLFPDLPPAPAESSSRQAFHPLKYRQRQTFGYLEPTDYASPPLNAFQRARRISNLWTDPTILTELVDHKCESLTPAIAAAIHRLKRARVEDGIAPNLGRIKQNGIARLQRIRYQDQITPIVTVTGPTSWSGPRCHPEQQRIVSLRELGRGQGVHDSYDFGPAGNDGSKGVKKSTKMVGNGVEGSVSHSIGREIFRSLLPLVLADAEQNPDRKSNFFLDLQQSLMTGTMDREEDRALSDDDSDEMETVPSTDDDASDDDADAGPSSDSDGAGAEVDQLLQMGYVEFDEKEDLTEEDEGKEEQTDDDQVEEERVELEDGSDSDIEFLN